MKQVITMLYVAALAAGVAAPAAAQAQAQAQAAAYATGTPSYRTLVVETVYPFSVAPYTPAVAVPAVTPGAPRATPESVLFQLVAAMKAADYDWNLSLWTPESQQQIRQRALASGEGKDYWQRQWRASTDRNYALLSRISYGKYVLIEYRYQAGASGKTIKDTMALEQQGGQWFLTQALANDPLLLHWDSPNGRVQALPAGFLPK